MWCLVTWWYYSAVYTPNSSLLSFSLFKEKKRKKQAVLYTQRNSEIPFFHILYAWYKSGASLVHCMLRLLPRNIAAFPSSVFLFRAASPPPTYPPHPPSNPIFFSVVCDEQWIRLARVVELIEFSPVWPLRLTARAIYFKIISSNRQSSSMTCSWAVSAITYFFITFYFILMWPSLMTGRDCP